MDGTEFITAMQPWRLGGLSPESGVSQRDKAGGAGNAGLFRDIFRSAVENVRASQLEVENKQYLLATGQLEDAHSLPIAEAKAQVSLELLIGLRNKALEGYNELMKMNI